MTSLGYVWRDHAQYVVTPTPGSKHLGDFVYDGGPASGHGVVLAEAKGSLRRAITPGDIRTECETAYRTQVQPYVATHCPLHVVHGYAVKMGARLASTRATALPPHAFIHVAETAFGAPPGGGFGGGGGAASGGPGATAVTAVALGNYRAAFMLAGAPIVVDDIDAIRRDVAPSGEEQAFDVITTRLGEFLVGQPGPTRDWEFGNFNRLGHRFAVHEPIARAFLTALSAMSTNRAAQPDTIQLPRLSSDLLATEAVFPDGFAYIKGGPPSRTLHWSARAGLR